jgi:transposase
MALRAACDSLPDYAKTKSPKKFTQPQLMACLVIKEFLQLDYRSTHILLMEWSDLRRVIGLTKVPHFTTLCAAAKRLLGKAKTGATLDAVLDHCRQDNILAKCSKQAAIDSTGLESRHVSAYFTKRCKRHSSHYKHRYPKLSAICDTASHLILGAVIDRGPKPDPVEAKQTLHEALNHQRFSSLLGDAGYESEGFHCLCRDKLGIRSIIPTTDRGRPRSDGKPRPVGGKYRKLMRKRFPKKTYGQRWQIETVFSMLKRNMGSALRARSYHSQSREIRLRIPTHNLAILWRKYYVLYRAGESAVTFKDNHILRRLFSTSPILKPAHT